MKLHGCQDRSQSSEYGNLVSQRSQYIPKLALVAQRSSTCDVVPGFFLYGLGKMIGCRRALANASAEYGDLPSVLITLPIDMKKLAMKRQHHFPTLTGSMISAYPNVAPDPSIYCPSVLIGPLGPAPYLMILNPPSSPFSFVLPPFFHYPCSFY